MCSPRCQAAVRYRAARTARPATSRPGTPPPAGQRRAARRASSPGHRCAPPADSRGRRATSRSPARRLRAGRSVVLRATPVLPVLMPGGELLFLSQPAQHPAAVGAQRGREQEARAPVRPLAGQQHRSLGQQAEAGRDGLGGQLAAGADVLRVLPPERPGEDREPPRPAPRAGRTGPPRPPAAAGGPPPRPRPEPGAAPGWPPGPAAWGRRAAAPRSARRTRPAGARRYPG